MIFLAMIGMMLLSGCSGYRTIEVPIDDGEWNEGNLPQTGRMYTQQDEGKYVIKPEPYSIKSKKKDPELLGPQRTYHAPSTTARRTRKAHTAPSSSGMTRAACIEMIGQARYQSYVQKYGSEKGALRRCLILKRLRG